MASAPPEKPLVVGMGVGVGVGGEGPLLSNEA